MPGALMKFFLLISALIICLFTEASPQPLNYQPEVATYDDTVKFTYAYDNEGNCTYL